MAYEKEDQGDENEFVHFEEEELGGDPEEVIEEETEEELVITERPGAAGAPQPPLAAPKPAARKKKPAAKKAKKKAKRSQKSSQEKTGEEGGQEIRQAPQEALTAFPAKRFGGQRFADEGPGSFLRALVYFDARSGLVSFRCTFDKFPARLFSFPVAEQFSCGLRRAWLAWRP